MGFKVAVLAVCKLCLNTRELRESHALSDSWFRVILRRSGGQAITIDNTRAGLIARSQDSWWDYLLCGECEQRIGSYEKYGIERLRGRPKGKSHLHEGGYSLRDFDYSRFKLFTTSLLWRAAISRHGSFQNVTLTSSDCEEARNSLLSGRAVSRLRFGCRLGRLIDPNKSFNQAALEEFIVSPDVERNRNYPFSVFTFVAGGYVFEFFTPQLPPSWKERPGVIRPTKVMLIPYHSIFEIRSMVKVMAAGIRKIDQGLVAFEEIQA